MSRAAAAWLALLLALPAAAAEIEGVRFAERAELLERQPSEGWPWLFR